MVVVREQLTGRDECLPSTRKTCEIPIFTQTVRGTLSAISHSTRTRQLTNPIATFNEYFVYAVV